VSFTSAQQKAIAARGNVLVVAGAGTGKTSTLVERCLNCLLDGEASLDEILMVTFTEAAATEMRQRIRIRLDQQIEKHSEDLRWPEQLALFDTAHIGTLHSFCLQLIRQHFYELELDPQLTVFSEEEAKLLADETLEEIFQEHYAGKTDAAAAVQKLIQTQARGWDQPIRALVLRLHHYTQTLRDPSGWFATQLAVWRSDEPTQWKKWLEQGVVEWRGRWLPELENSFSGNEIAEECANLLQTLSPANSENNNAGVFAQIGDASKNFPRGKAKLWRDPLKHFFSEAAFLHSLTRNDGPASPLVQDWNWVRTQMATLLELTQEFTNAFSKTKRELAVVDFHDLEQHTLRLLLDPVTHQPTPTALQWQKKLRYIFVDEYQDINHAQDAILQALSRHGADANRFLVGDVKQSIYRFRLADPHIFQGYIDTWRNPAGQAIPLVDNFRSREAILDFINSLFSAVMRRDVGSVPYDGDARLRFGDPTNRAALSRASNAAPAVELHLRLKGAGEIATPEDETESADAWAEVLNLEEAAKEARLAGLRLRELKRSAHQVWDKKSEAMRAVDWGDMAVLLRSPKGKMESYAREFARLNIPLTVSRGGFYESSEIMDLLSLLQLLDNPLQDLPVLAVLHSPLVGMTLDELAAVRLRVPRGHCWTALQRYHDLDRDNTGWPKADRFLKNFLAWRKLARQVSLSRCLESVLEETHYAEWLLTQSRGEQRHANVRRLLALAQQFDQFQRQGLFRFLRFIEAQQAAETEPQVAPVAGDDCVTLMSIHQSKGLEFPVVVVGDLGKRFNQSDLHEEIILDDEYGVCPQIKPPHTGQRYPSLPFWLAQQRQKKESLGEELRLLYVAMTRARDTLILTGTLSEKKFHKQLGQTAELTTLSLLAAKNYLDWIIGWSVTSGEETLSPAEGENRLWRWTIYNDLDERLLNDTAERSDLAAEDKTTASDAQTIKELERRLSWTYGYDDATREPAKTSVSALRRRLAQETDEDAAPRFGSRTLTLRSQVPARTGAGKLSAADVGTAHHTFLQLVSLERATTRPGLLGEAKRMQAERSLSSEEAGQLDLEAVLKFWQSALGQKIRHESNNLRRELAFTVRFSPEELSDSAKQFAKQFGENEFVVVQGVADLVVLLPREIWLVDFKTDRMTAEELPEKVKLYQTQLRLYAQALSRIHRRPVTESYLYFLSLKKSVKVEEE
jgi:ATP-dependent helicase/nuclease subunit A